MAINDVVFWVSLTTFSAGLYYLNSDRKKWGVVLTLFGSEESSIRFASI
jgi:hypothetical protein